MSLWCLRSTYLNCQGASVHYSDWAFPRSLFDSNHLESIWCGRSL
ncbi:hypothetical protein HMPREF9184_00085 [Streptococcus sp. oral taxon 058 str. F0407]|nr:hypothetical protein HMPREF9184_00085 [Streptococcus sp. oral taxon 058 str. F0407]